VRAHILFFIAHIVRNTSSSSRMRKSALELIMREQHFRLVGQSGARVGSIALEQAGARMKTALPRRATVGLRSDDR
jgi:hypothetical protein